MPKYYIFDMDNTLCESKQRISIDVKDALQKLKCPIIVISGASVKQMIYQLEPLKCDILAQSGNSTELWVNSLNKNEKIEIYKHIEKFGNIYSEEFLDDRGAQIAYSFIGHNNNKQLKKEFDPKQIIRRAILKQHPFKSKTLQCTIAGTTCFDYTHKNGTKGKNIERWLKAKKINKKDCIYYGDSLFKGGNDESVIGIIRTVAVKNPKDLLKKL